MKWPHTIPLSDDSESFGNHARVERDAECRLRAVDGREHLISGPSGFSAKFVSETDIPLIEKYVCAEGSATNGRIIGLEEHAISDRLHVIGLVFVPTDVRPQ